MNADWQVQWSILLGVSPINPSEGALRARYFACCCLASAGYSNIPLISMFLSTIRWRDFSLRYLVVRIC